MLHTPSSHDYESLELVAVVVIRGELLGRLKLLVVARRLSGLPLFRLLTEVELKGVKDRILVWGLVKFDNKRWKLRFRDITIAPLHDYLLPSMIADLESQIGPVARTLIIRYAKNVGLDDAKQIKEAIGRELSPDEVKIVLRNMLTMWCLLGWGKLERLELGENYLIAERSTSFEAEGYLRLGKGFSKAPRCYVAFGYVLGLVEGLVSKKVDGKETKCIAMGDDICRFELNW